MLRINIVYCKCVSFACLCCSVYGCVCLVVVCVTTPAAAAGCTEPRQLLEYIGSVIVSVVSLLVC